MKDVRKDHARLLNNLEFLQRLYTAKALALCISINPTTWSRKMKEPWKSFSYDEFYLIAKFCGISVYALLSEKLGVAVK